MKNNKLYLKNDKEDISYFEILFNSYMWIIPLIIFLGMHFKIEGLNLFLISFSIAYFGLLITRKLLE